MIEIQEDFISYPDNTSVACTVYFHGCELGCEDCSNPTLQEWKESGDTMEIVHAIEKMCCRVGTNKIVMCGGDPLHPKNVDKLKQIIYNLADGYEICIYTGQTINQVKQLALDGFKFIKCGHYDKNKKQISEKKEHYIQFSSTNQELYDEKYNKLSKNGRYNFH